VHLRASKTVHGARQLIQRLQRLSVSVPKAPATLPVEVPPTADIRVYLAGYMVHYFPGNVLREVDETAILMQGATARLLAFMNHAVPALAEGQLFREVELGVDFLQLLRQYINAFQRWKTPDSIRLQDHLKNALHMAITSLSVLDETEPETEERIEVRAMIDRLRAQLLVVGGQEAVDAFDAELVASHTSEVQGPESEEEDGEA
jgi:hypothetical protein